MTQITSHPPLTIQITSMQPPQTGASTALTFKVSQGDEDISNSLLLYPGEPGKILISLKNTTNRPQQWKLVIEGDFPIDWCNGNNSEFQEIIPEQKFELPIYLLVPADFFESQWALNRNQQRLQIDYQIQISVHTQIGNTTQQVAYQTFKLCVRPDTSYTDFLPTIYREVDFMGRLLSIFEQAFDPTVQTIDTMWAYLDPLTAPKALLPFLARWVAWDIDSRWSLDTQRRLIRNAIALYRWHGTRYGLRLYLHLYTGLPLDENLPELDKHISIREVFNNGFVFGATSIGKDSMLGGGRPYHFIIHLRIPESHQINLNLVKEIIEQQKPAFSSYELSFERYANHRNSSET